MPYRAYYFMPEGKLKAGLDEQDIKTAYDSREGLLWVDVEATGEEDGRFMERLFGFHRLAIEDCVDPQVHTPKVDDYDKYLFIILNGINYALEPDVVPTTELALFVGASFVVSSHNYPLPSVDAIARNIELDTRPMSRGASLFAHALTDSLIDNVIPTVDRMAEVVTSIEEEAIYQPHQGTLDALMRLKRSTVRIARVIGPQRDMLNRISNGHYPLLRQESLLFFRDVYDHIVTIQDRNNAIQQRADHCTLTYMSATANKQNETVKVLTFVATVLLPLNLIASIYGMNFHNMPELDWPWGYYMVLGIMAFVGTTLATFLWARSWLRIGGRKIRPAGLFRVAGLTKKQSGNGRDYRSAAKNTP
ncbi:MAG: magnesium/cobalt transporter CorA [SAR202 cluster bacterium]|nr:magnesium/cobalt transporter CorA [SAR202 cluster bacterium]